MVGIYWFIYLDTESEMYESDLIIVMESQIRSEQVKDKDGVSHNGGACIAMCPCSKDIK